jgi:MFS family permease
MVAPPSFSPANKFHFQCRYTWRSSQNFPGDTPSRVRDPPGRGRLSRGRALQPSSNAMTRGIYLRTSLALGATFIGSLPICAMPVMLLIYLVSSSVSPLRATILLALYSTANAIGLSVQGRLMGITGHAPVLAVASFVYAVVLIMLSNIGSFAILAVTCAVAGCSFPEINTSMRALLLQITDEKRSRYLWSTSAGLFEVSAVGGPLLGSWVVQGLGGQLAFVLSATWMLAATCTYIYCIRGTAHAAPSKRSSASGRGLQEFPLCLMYASRGAAFAALAVTSGLVAVSSGSPFLVGLLRSTLSVGALLGAIWLAVRSRLSTWRVILIAFMALTAASAVTIFVDRVPVLVGLLLVAGCALAPISIMTSTLVRKENAAASMAILQASSILAGGAATAGAGWLFESHGAGSAFGLAAGAAAFGLCVARIAAWHAAACRESRVPTERTASENGATP